MKRMKLTKDMNFGFEKYSGAIKMKQIAKINEEDLFKCLTYNFSRWTFIHKIFSLFFAVFLNYRAFEIS